MRWRQCGCLCAAQATFVRLCRFCVGITKVFTLTETHVPVTVGCRKFTHTHNNTCNNEILPLMCFPITDNNERPFNVGQSNDEPMNLQYTHFRNACAKNTSFVCVITTPLKLENALINIRAYFYSCCSWHSNRVIRIQLIILVSSFNHCEVSWHLCACVFHVTRRESLTKQPTLSIQISISIKVLAVGRKCHFTQFIHRLHALKMEQNHLHTDYTEKNECMRDGRTDAQIVNGKKGIH